MTPLHQLTETAKQTNLVPSRCVSIPGELIDHIASYATPPRGTPEGKAWRVANATLLSMALVSKAWGTAAQRQLYTRLHVRWRGTNAPKLLRTFEENPRLYATVREVAASYTTREDWLEEWGDSDEAGDAYARARVLFPQPATASDSDDDGASSSSFGSEPPEEVEAYVGDQTEAALEASLDGKWLEMKSSGRWEGSDFFWSLITQLPNLRTLVVDGFDMPVAQPFRRLLAPVLARLTTVGFRAELDPALLLFPLLHSVQTLCVSVGGTGYGQSTPLPPLTAMPTNDRPGRLRHLRVHHLGESSIAQFGLNLTTIVSLDVPYLSNVCVHNLIIQLPTLTALRSLRLGQDGSEARWVDLDPPMLDTLFEAIGKTHITHLYLDVWPTPAQLVLLPATLESLRINAGGVKPMLFHEALDDIPTWKRNYAPNLQEVEVVPCPSYLGGGRQWSMADMNFVVEQTTDFSLRFVREWEEYDDDFDSGDDADGRGDGVGEPGRDQPEMRKESDDLPGPWWRMNG
ncbi:hypothetical protein RQP46_011427 [Phenoliferia psychrophenolica]